MKNDIFDLFKVRKIANKFLTDLFKFNKMTNNFFDLPKFSKKSKATT